MGTSKGSQGGQAELRCAASVKHTQWSSETQLEKNVKGVVDVPTLTSGRKESILDPRGSMRHVRLHLLLWGTYNCIAGTHHTPTGRNTESADVGNVEGEVWGMQLAGVWCDDQDIFNRGNDMTKGLWGRNRRPDRESGR